MTMLPLPAIGVIVVQCNAMAPCSMCEVVRPVFPPKSRANRGLLFLLEMPGTILSPPFLRGGQADAASPLAHDTLRRAWPFLYPRICRDERNLVSDRSQRCHPNSPFQLYARQDVKPAGQPYQAWQQLLLLVGVSYSERGGQNNSKQQKDENLKCKNLQALHGGSKAGEFIQKLGLPHTNSTVTMKDAA